MADDTDNDLAVAATTVLSALSDQIKKPKRDKWIRPWIVQCPISGAYHALHGVFSHHLALHKDRCNLIQK